MQEAGVDRQLAVIQEQVGSRTSRYAPRRPPAEERWSGRGRDECVRMVAKSTEWPEDWVAGVLGSESPRRSGNQEPRFT